MLVACQGDKMKAMPAMGQIDKHGLPAKPTPHVSLMATPELTATVPTSTPVPATPPLKPTPDIEATVEAAMTQTAVAMAQTAIVETQTAIAAVPTNTPTPTQMPVLSTATSTDTPTYTPAPPIATPVLPTPSPTSRSTSQQTGSYPVPVLIKPEDEANPGPNPTFSWRWDGQLQDNEYFDLRMWPEGASDHRIGVMNFRDIPRQPNASGEYVVTTSIVKVGDRDRPNGIYYWSVAVMREVDGKMEDVSPEATPHKLIYGVGGDEGGGGPPGPIQP
jgi:hypothetical protein